MELEIINHSSYFQISRILGNARKDKTQKTYSFQFKFPNLLSSLHIHNVRTYNFDSPISPLRQKKYEGRPWSRRWTIGTVWTFSRCTRAHTPGHGLWKPARVQQGQETVSITPQLDLERYSRPCWPAFPLVSALYRVPCLAHNHDEDVKSAHVGGGTHSSLFYGRRRGSWWLGRSVGRRNSLRRGGRGEGEVQASYNRMLFRFLEMIVGYYSLGFGGELVGWW